MYYVRVYIHIYIFHVPYVYVYTHNSGIYIYSTVQHIHKGCNNYVHVQEFAGNICNNYMIITLQNTYKENHVFIYKQNTCMIIILQICTCTLHHLMIIHVLCINN